MSRARVKDVLRLVMEPCNYWRNVEVPAVLTQLDIKRGEKVLDIGSPKLPSLYAWKKLGAEVWATDLFPYFIDEYSHYKRRLATPEIESTYHIETQDARKLPYPDSFFDKVLSISVLEHIDDNGDSVAMGEIARVLKPGGVCCLTVPFANHFWEETIAREIYYKKPVEGKPVFFQRHYDDDALRKRLIEPSGMHLLALEHFGERGFPFERLNRRLPKFIKIPLAFGGPVFSKLFLHNVDPSTGAPANAALIALKKSPSNEVSAG